MKKGCYFKRQSIDYKMYSIKKTVKKTFYSLSKRLALYKY